MKNDHKICLGSGSGSANFSMDGQADRTFCMFGKDDSLWLEDY